MNASHIKINLRHAGKRKLLIRLTGFYRAVSTNADHSSHNTSSVGLLIPEAAHDAVWTDAPSHTFLHFLLFLSVLTLLHFVFACGPALLCSIFVTSEEF